MAKKINLEVIDEMYSAVLSQNESKERIDALRPQVEIAVLAFEQLTATEKEQFIDPRVIWASTAAVRDEERIRI